MIFRNNENKKGAHQRLFYFINLVGLYLNGFSFHSHLLIYQDTAAMFANDDLFALTDIRLALRRDLVKATRAGVALNGYYSKAVFSIITQTVVSDQ